MHRLIVRQRQHPLSGSPAAHPRQTRQFSLHNQTSSMWQARLSGGTRHVPHTAAWALDCYSISDGWRVAIGRPVHVEFEFDISGFGLAGVVALSQRCRQPSCIFNDSPGVFYSQPIPHPTLAYSCTCRQDLDMRNESILHRTNKTSAFFQCVFDCWCCSCTETIAPITTVLNIQ